MRIFMLLICLLLSACSTRHAYDALQTRNCYLSQGQTSCEGSVDYESYQKQRNELLKRDQSKSPPDNSIQLPDLGSDPEQP